ncbi:MAG: hypothetical protein LBS60_03790 [Deltaproteobacteria bacterium]|jgi:hypothetical protein|nr:hypothetical protein [Deltaproteobacteria bacterium]
MTAPLHHINQLYLHLPAINGQVAAEDAIAQDIQRITREAQDESYRRDLVEVVAETGSGAAPNAVRKERDLILRPNFKEGPKDRTKASAKARGGKVRSDFEVEALVDILV